MPVQASYPPPLLSHRCHQCLSPPSTQHRRFRSPPLCRRGMESAPEKGSFLWTPAECPSSGLQIGSGMNLTAPKAGALSPHRHWPIQASPALPAATAAFMPMNTRAMPAVCRRPAPRMRAVTAPPHLWRLPPPPHRCPAVGRFPPAAAAHPLSTPIRPKAPPRSHTAHPHHQRRARSRGVTLGKLVGPNNTAKMPIIRSLTVPSPVISSNSSYASTMAYRLACHLSKSANCLNMAVSCCMLGMVRSAGVTFTSKC